MDHLTFPFVRLDSDCHTQLGLKDIEMGKHKISIRVHLGESQ